MNFSFSLLPANSALLLLLLGSVAPSAEAFEIANTIDSVVPDSYAVEYSCSFENKWTSARHPVNFPGAAGKWSPPLLAAHPNSYSVWKAGELASMGVQDLAQTGSVGTLRVQLLVDQQILVTGSEQALGSTTQKLPTIRMTPQKRFLTSISKITPSSDWFSGFYSVSLVNAGRGTWYREIEIDVFPWDAGTKRGSLFTFFSGDTNPKEPIKEYKFSNRLSSDVFLNQAQNDILPMGTWTCSMQAAEATSPYDVVSSTNSRVTAQDEVEVSYRCSFRNLWTKGRHPALYPDSAHWSPPVMASHSSGYTMWREGSKASSGVEIVAESGSSAELTAELGRASAVLDVSVGRQTFNSQTQSQLLPDITVTKNRRFLSVISMIAPSPDWFSGFYDFDTVNSATNTFYRTFTIESQAFDAGTEDGNTYSGNNPATSPVQNIRRFTEGTLPSTDVFLNPGGNAVVPVGQWTCTLQAMDPGGFVVPCFSGRTTVEVQDEGVIDMQDLRVGDMVKVDDSSRYERVYLFGHNSKTLPASYISIYANGMKGSLEMSKDHMLFVESKENGRKAVPASMVKVGDSLFTSSGEVSVVAKVVTVSRVGAFAPFTMSGTIVVNGIVASSYVSMQDMSDNIKIGNTDTSVGHHDMAHLVTTPLRLMARLGFSISESYNEDGVSNWVKVPHDVMRFLMDDDRHFFTLSIVLFLLAVVVSPLYLVDLVLSSASLCTFMTLIVTVGWCYSLYSARTSAAKKCA